MKLAVRAVFAGAVLLLALSFSYAESSHPKKHRNAIIFIADGLRPGSVNSARGEIECVPAGRLPVEQVRGLHFADAAS